MDSIWNCAFGVDIDMQNDTDNEYFVKCESIFRSTVVLDTFARFGGFLKLT